MKQGAKYADRGARLKEFMEGSAYGTKKEFALALGIYPQHLNKYLDGIIDPMNLSDKLLKIGVDLHWLIEGDVKDEGFEREVVKIVKDSALTIEELIGAINLYKFAHAPVPQKPVPIDVDELEYKNPRTTPQRRPHDIKA